MPDQERTLSRRDFGRTTTLTAAGVMLGRARAAFAQGVGGPSGKQFRAGAAMSNITPPLGVSLDGTISQNGPAIHIHDELHARCLALDDGATQLALAVCDSTMISREIFDKAKELVREHTGLPADRMLMSATHTHSTPRPIGIWQGELDRVYEEFLIRRIADGVRRALNNLAPAQVGWEVSRKPEFVFNRRWFMRPGSVPPNPFGDSGEQVRMNPPRGSEDLVKPAGPVDPEISILSLRHADGRPMALLANYGLHYVGGGVRGHVSADYFGMFAERVGQLLDVRDSDPPFVGIMSNGTSADVNGINFREEPQREPPYSAMRRVAHSLAEEAVKVFEQIEHRSWAPLEMRESRLELGVRHPDEKRLAWAREIWSKAEGKKRLTRPEVYAREAIALSQYPPSLSLKLQALRIGDLGIAAIPCEVFTETGLAIKQHSPLRPTFTIELANGFNGYLPTAEQHQLGGYETWPARSSCLEVGAESKIRAELLRLLRAVWGTG